MTGYQQLGATSIGLLFVALGLSAYILIGKHSRRATYFISGTVLALMLAVTVLSVVIYSEYGIPSK